MNKGLLLGFWRLIQATLFYPIAFGIMIWLTLTGQHWGWGLLVIIAVLVLDPIYRIILGKVLSWRPKK